MRHLRIKPTETDTIMHVYNRIAGFSSDFPFGNAEKEQFLRRLNKLNEFYVIDVLATQVMGNHYHILIHIPAEIPSNEEAAARYFNFYDGKQQINPDSPDCTLLAAKLRDVSEFIRELQQPFTRWFNRTRKTRRHGALWGGRFKNTILENGLAVWDCWKYIEMNPVRAGMVDNPADYRFSSFGQWSATGKNPYEDAITEHLMPGFSDLLHVESLQELKIELKKEFARITETEAGKSPAEIETAIATAAEKELFTTKIDRRVRYWVDGLVIGSDIFILNTVSKARGSTALAKRRLTGAVDSPPSFPPLYSFKQLRILIT
jgi:REP element-mobilizing transposase RayT